MRKVLSVEEALNILDNLEDEDLISDEADRIITRSSDDHQDNHSII